MLPASGLTGAATLPDYRVVVSDAEIISALDLVAPELEYGEAAAVRDAVDWTDDRVLILTEDELLVWDGALRPSPMSDVVGAAQVHDIDTRGEELWLVGDMGLEVWKDGWLSALAIDGDTARAPLASATWPDRGAVMWVAVDNGVMALSAEADGFIALENAALGAPATALAVDQAGSLWAAAGGQLHRRDSDGVWSVFALPTPVTGVFGNAASERIWVATEGGVFTAAADDFTAVTGIGAAVGDFTGVDDVGRLLSREGGALSRASIGRPVAVRGLPGDGLLFATSELFIAPTAGDQVVGLSATLGGVSLDVEDLGTVWRATLEPETLDAGEYDLTVDVEYGAATSNAAWQLIITNPTWTNDIQPLFQERCSACHGGTTGTVVLDNPEAWEMRFDEIVSRVTRNNMPLGQEPLSDVQKGMIRAWGAKGFPR